MVVAVGIGGLAVAGIVSGMDSPSVGTPEAVMDAGSGNLPEAFVQEYQEVKLREYQTAIASMDWDAEESEMLARIAMAEAEGEENQ